MTTTELFSNTMYKPDDYRGNSLSFKCSLRQPFNFKQHNAPKIGIESCTIGGGYKNINENKVIEIYETVNGKLFQYRSSVRIEPGYYPTARLMVEALNYSLKLMPTIGNGSLPFFTADDKKRIKLHLPADAVSKMCISLPKVNLGFTRNQIALSNQYDQDYIEAEFNYVYDHNPILYLFCNLTPNVLAILYGNSSDITNVVMHDISEDYFDEDIHEIEFKMKRKTKKGFYYDATSDICETTIKAIFSGHEDCMSIIK
jgi:hypothetical protein